jgi:5-methylcytosine-specific restriction endonuclease McrA
MRPCVYDWAAIQRYYDEGHGFVECQKRFGFTHCAWMKAIKRGRLRVAPTLFADRRRRYDWAVVQRYYDEGNSVRACMQKFGFNVGSWEKARLRGEVRTRPPGGMPIDELLLRRGSRRNVKIRLLGAGLIENKCDRCGISDWLGEPLSVHIDHINGDHLDHRLENLRMLCPNCHSQTDTYGARNRRRRRLQELEPVV